MPKLTLYHSSRVHFDQLSNAYHYSGNGKMGAGWGIYLSKNRQGSCMFGASEWNFLSTVWQVDGKRLYHQYLNNDFYFNHTTAQHRERMIDYTTIATKNWRDKLLEALEEDWDPSEFWDDASRELAKANELRALALRKVREAQTVKAFLTKPLYLYTVEVDARRIFDNVEEPDPVLRRAINDRLRYEKRKFHWPDYPIDRKYYPNIYGKLYALFAKRYQYSRPKRDFAKMTSLFLHRLGYDVMLTNYLKDEYLLFDVSRAKIVDCKKIQ